MSLSLKYKLIYLIAGVFILANMAFTLFDNYYFNLLPLGLLIVGLALFRLDIILLFIVFCTPLSVGLEALEFNLGVHLPTEPLMAGAMLVFLVKVFFDKSYPQEVMRHPLSIAILLNLAWLFLAIFPSELPVVSIKFLVSRLWFVVTFYFMAIVLFRDDRNIERYMWLFIVPLSGVIIYTIINHAIRGFAEKPAHWVMQPFFKDHTSYGAIISMYIPIVFSFFYNPRLSLNSKIISGFFFVILLAGVILSYTRAAWVSILGAIVIFFLIKYRVKLWAIISVAVIALFVVWNFQTQIMQKLEQNKQDSSSDLAEHVESISNVATDASNLERLNRWNSALKMWMERPVFGHGPGTYAFLYAPYQHSSQLTIISTNFGDGGNAHSEYFGPLAEAGTLGLLTFLAILFLIYYRGIRLYQSLPPGRLRLTVIAIITGLSTYLIHGTLNNFLDTDKASVPFWGFVAVLISIEIFHKNRSAELDA